MQARLFGIEKGYEKFMEMGELQAKAWAWSDDIHVRLSNAQQEQKPVSSTDQSFASRDRIMKHMEILHTLLDPSTVSFENTDDAVSTFDDRLKRAHAKCKVITRLLGESADSQNDEVKETSAQPQSSGASIAHVQKKDLGF